MALLRGRRSELAVLRDLLAGAVEGRSGVLVLRGEAGIGKSALLDVAVSAASRFVVLAARGVQSESEIAFAGLQELFGPVLGLVERLPDRQRAVLAGALALGPPVFGDPLAVRAATLSLLGLAAEAAPVLVVVDDAHWLDPASAEALAFAARRLDSERTVAWFAVRDGDPSAFDQIGLRELTLFGLGESAAREVLADRAGQAIAGEVAERLLTVAGGNPLAVRATSRPQSRHLSSAPALPTKRGSDTRAWFATRPTWSRR
jgi:predicted ATPase